MKIDINTRRVMLEKIEKVLKLYNIKASDVRTTGTMHQIWCKVFYYTTYPNDNPNALFNGQRVFNQDEAWEMYPCGCNDGHMTTALRWCFSYLAEKEILEEVSR